MPYVVNGIGTWYYGKKNQHRIQGNCSICHQSATLQSYDVGHYFVCFMIPIIPLGKKRILEHCSACDYHYSVPLKKWQAQRAADSNEVLAKLQNNPNDPEAMIAGLELAMLYQDQELFEKLAQTLMHDAPARGDLHLSLGMGYDYFGRRKQAIAAYQESLRLDDLPRTRERLMLGMLSQNMPAEAEIIAQPLLDQLSDEQRWIPLALVSGYQECGMHDAALNLIQRVEATVPAMADHKQWQKLKKHSLKYQGTEKRIRSDLTAFTHGAGVDDARKHSPLGKVLLILLILAAICAYFGICFYRGYHRSVILINGTDKAYQISYQNQSVEIPALSVQTIETAEGQIDFSSSHHKLANETFPVTIATNFFTRPFSNPVFIVNLDGLAVLEHQTAIYAVNPPPLPPPEYLFGEIFYHFDSIDFLFSPLPDTIQLSKNQSITKTQLNLITGKNVRQRLDSIAMLEPPDKRIRYLKKLVDWMPEESEYLYALTNELELKEIMAILNKLIRTKPINVDAHLLYQQLTREHFPKENLPLFYAQLLKDEQNQAEALFLQAQLATDHKQAMRLYEQAIQAPNPSAHAMYQLAKILLARGEFDAALKLINNALTIKPYKSHFLSTKHEILAALNRYQELVDYFQRTFSRSEIEKHPEEFIAYIRALVCVKQRELARTLLLNYVAKIRKEDADLSNKVKLVLEGILISADQNRRAYLEHCAKHPAVDNFSFFIYYMLKGDLLKAEAVNVGDSASDLIQKHGLLYIMADRKDQVELASHQFKAFLDALKSESIEGESLVDLIENETPMKANEILDLWLARRIKRVVLRVMAQRHPELAAKLLPLARKLDTDRDGYSLVMQLLDDLERTETRPDQ